MKKHSKYSASGSKIWLNCPGSIGLCEQMPKKPESEYANEGTLAHELAEIMLRQGIIPINKYNEEMIRHVTNYKTYIFNRVMFGPTHKKLSIEKKFKLSFVDDECFGTCDACIEDDECIEIIDLKYGKGIHVYPKNNSQLMYYALGALYNEELKDLDYSKKQIILTIVQPRTDNPIRHYETNYAELLSFADKMRHAIKESKKSNPPFDSGDHCRFCNAVSFCPLVKEINNEMAVMIFEESAVENRDDFVRKVIERKYLIEKTISECEEYALNKLSKGENIKGLKLKEGRRTKIWKDNAEETLCKLLPNDCYDIKLKSPTQIEKLINKNNKDNSIFDLITIVPGKLKVVPENSKGEIE